MIAKQATDLLAASLVNGKFWAPRTHAVSVLYDTLKDKQFSALFAKIEEGPFKTYFTEKEAGPWNLTCTEPGLVGDSAAFANYFILQIQVLVSIGNPLHYWAMFNDFHASGQIEDDKGDFVGPLRSLGYEYLTKYSISGATFPGKWDTGAKTIREEAKRLLDLLGAEVYPFRNDLLLVLFMSECCTRLARRLINTLNPCHVASGMRRASIVQAQSKDRKKCELSFTVLAHAAAIVSSDINV